jgi:hypothetical protein
MEEPFRACLWFRGHFASTFEAFSVSASAGSQYRFGSEAYQCRMNEIIELDESRRKAFDQIVRNQDKVKRTFDKSSRPRNFQKDDTVLLWDKRHEKPGKHKKFDSLWTWPYII